MIFFIDIKTMFVGANKKESSLSFHAGMALNVTTIFEGYFRAMIEGK